jgi:hypothetical protein
MVTMKYFFQDFFRIFIFGHFFCPFLKNEKKSLKKNYVFLYKIMYNIIYMSNPFLLDYDFSKKDYTDEDYELIQQKLKEKEEYLRKYMLSVYPQDKNIFKKVNGNTFAELDDIRNRMSKGSRQILINKNNNQLPHCKLYKIGNGGNNCIVNCTTFAQDGRYTYSQNIKQSLENVNFNGYLYVFYGLFPNPTGEEIKYICVPYSFKIFMMLEAKKKGFDKVIWIDACCIAINNLDSIFDNLEKYNIICGTCKHENNYYNLVIPPKIIESINTIMDYNLFNDWPPYIISIVFGLNFKSTIIDEFIKDYYKMVEFGTPFVSLYPEENVFSVILGNHKYKELSNNFNEINNIRIFTRDCDINVAKQHGYCFYQCQYK